MEVLTKMNNLLMSYTGSLKSEDGKIVRFRNVINTGLGARNCFLNQRIVKRVALGVGQKVAEYDDIDNIINKCYH